jgi:hydrogenase maturation protease
MKILIAGVGNVLRGDDGFGIEVANTLAESGRLSEEVSFFEAGIAGISLVQELMNGYDALVIADAVDRHEAPGTVFLIEPDIPDLDTTDPVGLHRALVDAHYTEPSRVLLLAKALGVLPARVFIIGCQPASDEFGSEMSPAVKRAIQVALERIESLIKSLRESGEVSHNNDAQELSG